MEEYYYNLENALDARSQLETDLDGLENFKINESKDPYVMALKAKYLDHDLNKHYSLLQQILNGEIHYPPWESLSTNIRTFVYNQLSNYWSLLPHKDLIKSSKYNNLAIIGRHRDALYSDAELNFSLLTEINPNNTSIILKMLQQVVDAGRTEAYELMIEIQSSLLSHINYDDDVLYNNTFLILVDYYEKIINYYSTYNNCDFLVKYLNLYEKLFNDFQLRCNDENTLNKQRKSFITFVCNIEHQYVDKYIIKYSDLIYPSLIQELLKKINTNSSKFTEEMVLDRIILIFNLNRLLFHKYIKLLAKSNNYNFMIEDDKYNEIHN